MPNLLIAELWNDDAYAEKVICGSENRPSIQQVREVRELAQQRLDASTIQTRVGARTPEQVEGVIKGKTYRRIR